MVADGQSAFIQSQIDAVSVKFPSNESHYIIYRDAGAIRIRKKWDDTLMPTSHTCASEAMMDAITDAGDVPIHLKIMGQGLGLMPISTVQHFPVGRANECLIEGDHRMCGFVCSAAAPKPFEFTNGTVGAINRYRLPIYRKLMFDAALDDGRSLTNMNIGFFAANPSGTGQTSKYVLYERYEGSEELFLRAGKTGNEINAAGGWFGWFDFQTSFDNSYDSETAAWQTDGPYHLRYMYPWSGQKMGGILFSRMTGRGVNRMANVLIPDLCYLYRCEFDSGSVPNYTGGSFCYIGNKFHMTDVAIVECNAHGIGDVIWEFDQYRYAYVRDFYAENFHSALFTNRENPYWSSSQSALVDGCTLVTDGQTGKQCEGFVFSSFTGVHHMGPFTGRNVKRVFRNPTMTSDTRHLLKVQPGCVIKSIDLEAEVDDVGAIQQQHAVTITASGNLITHTAHGYANGDPVRFVQIGSAVPLNAYSTYHIVNPTTNTYQLAASYNGSPITITADGTGIIQKVPSWLFDGSGTKVILSDLILLQGGTSDHPNNIKLKVRTRSRGKVTTDGGTQTLFYDGITVDPAAFVKLDVDWHEDIQIYGLGLTNAHRRVIRVSPNGGTLQVQEDYVDTDGSTTTWSMVLSGAQGGGWSGTVSSLSGNASASTVENAIVALAPSILAPGGIHQVQVSKAAVGGGGNEYTIDWGPSGSPPVPLGVVNIAVSGNASLSPGIPYGAGTQILGGKLKMSWEKGCVGFPPVNYKIIEWDGSQAVLADFTEKDWDTLYAPSSGMVQNYLVAGSLPPNVIRDNIYPSGKRGHNGGIIALVVGSGGVSTLTIPHGLGEAPDPANGILHIAPQDAFTRDNLPKYFLSADATNITVNAWTTLALGTYNLFWIARVDGRA